MMKSMHLPDKIEVDAEAWTVLAMMNSIEIKGGCAPKVVLIIYIFLQWPWVYIYIPKGRILVNQNPIAPYLNQL